MQHKQTQHTLKEYSATGSVHIFVMSVPYWRSLVPSHLDKYSKTQKKLSE